MCCFDVCVVTGDDDDALIHRLFRLPDRSLFIYYAFAFYGAFIIQKKFR